MMAVIAHTAVLTTHPHPDRTAHLREKAREGERGGSLYPKSGRYCMSDLDLHVGKTKSEREVNVVLSLFW